LRARDIAFATWALLCGLVCLLVYPLHRVPLRSGEPGGARQAHAPAAAAGPNRASPNRARLLGDYGRLPLQFEENRGQTDAQVRFLSRGAGYALFLTSDEAVLQLRSADFGLRNANSTNPQGEVRNPQSKIRNPKSTVVRLKLLGANREPRITGANQLPGKANYFTGSDPSRWRIGIPTYAKVEYRQIYPGVDLVYYGNQRQLEHDFVVAPGADPKQIRLAVEGAERVEVEAQGDAVLRAGGGEVRLRAPLAYQDVDGQRRPVAAKYLWARNPQSAIRNLQSGAPHSALRAPHSEELSFQLGAYDRALPLVIDPVLVYSTYLGGSGNEIAAGIAVDSSGNAYITGQTLSANFPTSPLNARLGPPNPSNTFDVFIAKLDGAGSALVYSTYLGGSGDDVGAGIAVCASNYVYVTGWTASTNFPTTVGAFQSTRQGAQDAFVAKLNPTGSALEYSTYLGGGNLDFGRGIAVDSNGNVYVTGETNSINFPTLYASQTGNRGGWDAFVAKLSGAGSPVYSTYLGGNSDDYGAAIAVDPSGNAYVTGYTRSTNFPTTGGQTTVGGVYDAFVTKLDATGAQAYSTYLGGTGSDYGKAIAVDSSGYAYITGLTASYDFPTNNAFQLYLNSGSCSGNDCFDAFAVKLDTAGSPPIYSTYLGGSAYDAGNGIAVDSYGNAYIAGATNSTDFPTGSAYQSANNGMQDAFVVKLGASGATLLFSTYLGGAGIDSANAIAVDGAGAAYVAGETQSVNFPTAGTPPLQGALAAGGDAFVAKLTPPGPPAGGPFISSLSPPSATASGPAFTLTINGSGFGYNSMVYWNEVVLPRTYASSTQLQVEVSADYIAAPTTANVKVFDPMGGGYSNTVPLVVYPSGAAPTIASLSPANALAGGPAFTLTINGSGFTQNSTVYWNELSVPITYVNGTKLTAAISQGCIAAPGTAQVKVFDSAGGWSNSVSFLVYQVGTQAGCTPPPPDLKLWWPAEGDNTDVVYGAWAYGNYNYSPGKVGLAFDFSGNSYLYAPPYSLPPMTSGQITVDAWIMPKASNGRIVDRWYPGDEVNPPSGYALEIFYDAELGNSYLRLMVASSVLQSTAPLTTDGSTWTHVTGVYDGANLKLYINGLPTDTGTATGVSLSNELDLYIGAGSYSGSAFYGLIDEVEIFDRALADTEILAIVTAGSAGKCWAGATGAVPVDLMLFKSAPNPAPLSQGESINPFTYTLTVINASPDPAYGVVVTDTLPPGMVLYDTPYPSQGMCTGDSTVTCYLGTLDGLYLATVELSVYTLDSGPATNTASVTAINPDPNPSNNVASLEVTVAVPAPVIYYTDPDSAVAGSEGLHLGIFGLYLQPNSVVYWNGSERTTAFCPYGLALYIDLTAEDLAKPGLAWFTVYDLDTGLESAPQAFIIYPNSPENCTPPPYGLVSWWPGEGNGNDVMGRNSGTPKGTVAFAPGMVSEAFSLDGNSYIEAPDSPSLAFTEALTIDAWIKRTANKPGCARIVDKITPGGSDGFLLEVCDGYLHMKVGPWELTGTTLLPLNEFVHVAGVFDGYYGELNLYVNGMNDGYAYLGGGGDDIAQGRRQALSVRGKLTNYGYGYPLIPTNNLSLRIGANQEGKESFIGLIDEADIYNTVLSSEISAIYTAGPAGKCNPFACAPPPSNLVSWWPGESDEGDMTGANPATPQGNVGFVTAIVGKGFNFDGSTGYLQVQDSPSLSPSSFTIDAWVKPQASNGRIVDKFDSSPSGYALGVDTDGFLTLTVGSAVLTSTSQLQHDLWTHVAAVFDGTQTPPYQMKLYINGAPDPSSTATAASLLTNARPLRIGADQSGGHLFTGVIDELEIYSRALADTEIAAIYMAGGAGKCTAPYSPDLALTKEATLNSNLTYTLTVTNNSAQAATGVTVTDPLPEGVSFVSASASPSGTCTATTGTVTCILGTLIGGAAPTTITLVTQPIVSGEVVNTATVTLNEADPDTSNNTATVKTTIVANPVPSITSLSPPGAVAGGGDFALDVLGSNFVSGSVVQWNGGPRTTKFMSSGQLTATISAADIAVAGTAEVTVFNPLPGGGTSNALTFLIAPLTCVAPPSGLVGWWRFEGDTKDIAAANNGTVLGASGAYAAGKVGQAFSLNGSDWFVIVSDSSSLATVSSAVTIDAWINPQPGSGLRVIAAKNSSPGSWGGYTLKLNDGRLEMVVADNPLLSSSALPTNTWVHVAGVYDGTAMRLYVNGALAASTAAGAAGLANTFPLTIGANAGGTDIFSGLIDELEIYNHALSGTEIAGIYYAGSLGKCRSAVPAISSLSPSAAFAGGGGFTLTVNGANYMPGSVVRWNGADRTTAYVSAAQLTATITAGDIAVVGAVPVTVFTPLGGESYSVVFTVIQSAQVATYNLPRQFSGTQGGNNWSYYQAFGPGSYSPATWTNCISPSGCGTAYKWGGGNNYFEIDGRDPLNWLLPGASAHFIQTGEGSDAAIGWQAPQAGMIRIAAMLNTAAPEASTDVAGCWSTPNCWSDDGVWLSIWSGGTRLTADQRSFHGKPGDARVPAALISTSTAVAAGDMIYFYVSRGAWQDSDGAFYSFTISYDPAADLDYPVSSHTASGNVLALSATDSGGSGVAVIEYAQYSPAGDGWHTYSGPITFLEPGTYKLMYRAIDQAGNTEPYHTVSLTLSSEATCVTLPSGLAAWWPGDGSYSDVAGGNAGTPQGGMTFVTGLIGQAMQFDGATGYVRVPASSSLNVGAGSGLTIDAWIKPSDISTPRPIVEWNQGSDYGTHLWISTLAGGGVDPGNLYANLTDTSGADHIFRSAGGLVAANAFQHIALTYDKASGMATLFVNGVAVAQQNLGTFTPQASFDLYLGRRPSVLPVGVPYFAGAMDEVELYSRALTPTEIAGIYNAGALGKCLVPLPTLASILPAAGNRLDAGIAITLTGTNFISGLTTVNLPAGFTVNAAGPFTVVNSTTATVTIDIAGTAATGANNITVTNAAPGGGTSAAQTFTVNNPLPAITSISPPTAVAGTPGLALTVTGSNFVPESVVRWNGQDRTTTPVDSTHLSAAITTADLAVAGTAQVTVFNPAPGGGTSGSLPFTIGFLIACTPPPSGLVGWWPGDGGPNDMVGGNNATMVNGASFVVGGMVGGAFDFQNAPNTQTGQFVQIAAPVGLPLGNSPRTMDLWFRTNANLSTYTESALIQYGAQAQDNVFGLITSANSPGRLYFFGGNDDLPGVTTLQPNTWYHVAVTYDGTTLKLYLNGQLENSKTTTSLNTVLDSNGLTIGLRPGSATWDGQIDEVEIFNRALSQSEIQAVFNAGALGKCHAAMPAISSLSPSSTPAGGAGFSLTVNGSNFQSNSVVRWNGANRTTTYGSATQLTATIPATDIALMGTAQVTVFTPLAGESAPATFTITGLIACAAPPSGLVSWWPGEAGAQDIADSNSGTLVNGAATAAGKVGQALSFDGVDDHVLVPFNSNLNPTGPFTVGLWLKASPQQVIGDGSYTVVDKSHGWIDNAGWAIQGDTGNGTLGLLSGKGGGFPYTNFVGAGTGVSVLDDQWHHFSGVYTGSAIEVYLDGVLKGSTPYTGLPVNNTRDLYIGAAWHSGTPTRQFHGLVDEVQYYSRALSLAEVRSLYNAGGYGLCRQADLALTMTAPSSSNLGVNVNYTLTVTNNGPVAASGVVGSLPLPSGASLVSSGASQGSCISSAVVTCALGNIASGAAVTVNLLLHPTQSGTLTATASVSGNEADPNPSNNSASASTSLSGWVYVVGDSAPGASDGVGGFGDGVLDNLDLISALRAITWVVGFRPPDCSDRFDAMDAYPTDAEVLRGGDAILDNLDLVASLRRVTNADTSRPTRTSLGCLTRAPGMAAMRRPSLGQAGNLRLDFGEARAEAGRALVPVYLTAAARLDLMGLSLALGLPGGGGAPLVWLAGEAGAPTLTDNGLPGTLALSWLGGLRLQAGQRVLLGYAEVPGGAPAGALQFIGAIANSADGRPLAVGLPSLTMERR